MNQQLTTVKVFSARTTTGYSTIYSPRVAMMSFQAIGATTAGSGAATVKVWGSLVAAGVAASGTDVEWYLIDTLSLTLGTTVTNDFGNAELKFASVKFEVDAISGTGGYVDVYWTT